MANLKSNGYTVYFGNSALLSLNTFLLKMNYSRCFILCDENSLQHCLPHVVIACPQLGNADIIEVESGEINKSMETCTNIWEIFLEQKADKHTLLINLGGGVISDLGGFMASVFKRGIPYIHIPTSLLAMADACLGGKNGIDFMGIKNSLGTISKPEAVFVCPPFLNTLEEHQVLNGWVEVFKMALIADKKMWNALSDISQVGDPSAFIFRSLELKNAIVLKDPLDKAQRKVLNFGHSLGHAIEALVIDAGEEILHGSAVCSGMILESHIAMQKKLITVKEYTEIKTRLRNTFGPMKTIPFSKSQLLEKLGQDKKNKAGSFRFSLLKKIGACAYDVEVNEKQISKALEAYHKA
ncbi:MAG: 3-dehydroquinate synthase [Bacteroidia bacterium]|nr:3-dehydroquinate synthase [Bacteroidia bacterium]